MRHLKNASAGQTDSAEVCRIRRRHMRLRAGGRSAWLRRSKNPAVDASLLLVHLYVEGGGSEVVDELGEAEGFDGVDLLQRTERPG